MNDYATAGRELRVETYDGEPIYLIQTEGEPDTYFWDGEVCFYPTIDQCRCAIREHAIWWAEFQRL